MIFYNSDMCQASKESMLRMQYSALNLGILNANEIRSSMCIDIFETLDRLIFPYDPIRDYTEREIKKINEKFRKVESLLGL